MAVTGAILFLAEPLVLAGGTDTEWDILNAQVLDLVLSGEYERGVAFL